jgi:hypothetical protein
MLIHGSDVAATGDEDNDLLRQSAALNPDSLTALLE